MATAQCTSTARPRNRWPGSPSESQERQRSNPNAHMQKEVTMDEVLKSRVSLVALKLIRLLTNHGWASVVILHEAQAGQANFPTLRAHYRDWPVSGHFLPAREGEPDQVKAARQRPRGVQDGRVRPTDINVAEYTIGFTIAGLRLQRSRILPSGTRRQYIESGVLTSWVINGQHDAASSQKAIQSGRPAQHSSRTLPAIDQSGG